MTKAQIEERRRGMARAARKGVILDGRIPGLPGRPRTRIKAPRMSTPSKATASESREDRVARLRTEKPACPICKRKAICWDASDRVLCLKCGAQESA